LENGSYTKTYVTGANVKEWLPGDILHDEALFIPHDIPIGNYNIQVALLDHLTGEPAINLAIEGKRPDGWYTMGTIRVNNIAHPVLLISGNFFHPTYINFILQFSTFVK
jgi:hypothetical protein